MAKKRINTKDLINKIENIAKARMASQEVISLDALRGLARKEDPKVILVIEDDETMRTALKRIFEVDGFVVKLAADGTDLASVLDDTSPDLILLDIGLPWLNGFELAEMMKSHKDLKKIPLVFVSGRSSEEDVKQAFEIGADDFIKKPFDIDKLKKTVAALLKVHDQGPA